MRTLEHPFGVRYWAVYYKGGRREVFEHIATDLNTGMFWFQSRENKTRIARNHYQLVTDGAKGVMKPLLIQGGRVDEEKLSAPAV